VLSQFTRDDSPNRPLAEFGFPKGVYPLGRLDADSEGLLLLSDEPHLNAGCCTRVRRTSANTGRRSNACDRRGAPPAGRRIGRAGP